MCFGVRTQVLLTLRLKEKVEGRAWGECGAWQVVSMCTLACARDKGPSISQLSAAAADAVQCASMTIQAALQMERTTARQPTSWSCHAPGLPCSRHRHTNQLSRGPQARLPTCISVSRLMVRSLAKPKLSSTTCRTVPRQAMPGNQWKSRRRRQPAAACARRLPRTLNNSATHSTTRSPVYAHL